MRYLRYPFPSLRFFLFLFLYFSFDLRSGRNLVNKNLGLATEAFALVLTLAFCPTICSRGVREGGGEVVPRESLFQSHDPPRPRTVTNAVGTTQHGLKHGPPTQAIACAFKHKVEEREREESGFLRRVPPFCCRRQRQRSVPAVGRGGGGGQA